MGVSCIFLLDVFDCVCSCSLYSKHVYWPLHAALSLLAVVNSLLLGTSIQPSRVAADATTVKIF